MFKTPEEAISLVNELKRLLVRFGRKWLSARLCGYTRGDGGIKDRPEGRSSKYALGSGRGIYRGDISMLRALGCTVIIGHSNGDSTLMKRMKLLIKSTGCLAHGLKPILCVGETLEEREAGITASRVEGQVRKGLEHLSSDNVQIW